MVLEIDVDPALLGAARACLVEAHLPGVVAAGIRSIASGHGAISVEIRVLRHMAGRSREGRGCVVGSRHAP